MTGSNTNKSPKNPQSSKKQQKRNQSQKPKAQRRQRRSIPAAYGFSDAAYAHINGSGPVVSLVCQEIFSLRSSKDGAFILPICPTKWAGTRTQVLASTYTAHRPLELTLKWIPSVPTSTSGMITVGTVFDGARINLSGSYDTDTRTLAATNGGFVTTIWNPGMSTVQLKRNLRANTFPLYEVSDDDIPLWVAVINSSSSEGVIGQLLVKAKFTLRNPSMNAATPVTWSGEASIVKGESSSTMTINGEFKPSPVVGNMYNFAFGKNLTNDTGATIAQALQTVGGQVTNLSPLTFTLTQPFATQSAYGSVIGLANF